MKKMEVVDPKFDSKFQQKMEEDKEDLEYNE